MPERELDNHIARPLSKVEEDTVFGDVYGRTPAPKCPTCGETDGHKCLECMDNITAEECAKNKGVCEYHITEQQENDQIAERNNRR